MRAQQGAQQNWTAGAGRSAGGRSCTRREMALVLPVRRAAHARAGPARAALRVASPDMRDTIAPSLASVKAPRARVTDSTVGIAMGMPPTTITSMLVRVGQPPAGRSWPEGGHGDQSEQQQRGSWGGNPRGWQPWARATWRASLGTTLARCVQTVRCERGAGSPSPP